MTYLLNEAGIYRMSAMRICDVKPLVSGCTLVFGRDAKDSGVIYLRNEPKEVSALTEERLLSLYIFNMASVAASGFVPQENTWQLKGGCGFYMSTYSGILSFLCAKNSRCTDSLMVK